MPAYNHEKYITKAIDSVLMQKTNFEWELLIHDDCSIDETLSIARRYTELYPQQIKVISEIENQGLMKSYKRLIDISQGLYLAILESDDLWIDENKLQTQVDFLERNKDYAFVAADIVKIDGNGDAVQLSKEALLNAHIRNTEKWYEHMLGNTGMTGACTVMFRKSDYLKYCDINEYIKRGFLTFDYPVWLSLSFHKKCKYFQTAMAAYRIIPTSLSNNVDAEKNMRFNLSIAEIEAFIIEKYGYGNLSEQEYNHRACNRIIGKALKFRKYTVFCKYAKKLVPTTIKEKIMHLIPTVYYWMFRLYHLKNNIVCQKH